MKIKESGLERTPLNRFDLLGDNEVALSKAFAWILGHEPKILYRFLHSIGVNVKNTKNNFKNTSIVIERHREEGRTDIEIKQGDKFHIIIESKVGNNKVSKQREQYLKCFSKNSGKNVLCFITGVNDYKLQKVNAVDIHNLSWNQILNIYDNKDFCEIKLVDEFLSFIRKGYKMNNQKEILIQDLAISEEIKKYIENNIYRRKAIFGSPLYFAPYFTRKSGRVEGEGVSYLSKILGILTLSPKDIDNYKDELSQFTENEILLSKWVKGIKEDNKRIKEDNKRILYTYFFLDTPLKLRVPLKKDVGRGKGIGTNWISKMIPKNRCVTFQEFTQRLIDSQIKLDA